MGMPGACMTLETWFPVLIEYVTPLWSPCWRDVCQRPLTLIPVLKVILFFTHASFKELFWCVWPHCFNHSPSRGVRMTLSWSALSLVSHVMGSVFCGGLLHAGAGRASCVPASLRYLLGNAVSGYRNRIWISSCSHGAIHFSEKLGFPHHGFIVLLASWKSIWLRK